MSATDALAEVLRNYVGTIVARSIVEGASNRCGVDPEHLTAAQVPQLVDALGHGVAAFVAEPEREHECVSRLTAVLCDLCGAPMGSSGTTRLQVDIAEEYDIVTARDHTRTICDHAGFGVAEQIKIATVVSELARNIVLYVGRGRIELELVDGDRRGIQVRAIDRGPGIPDVEAVLSGSYRSKTGMGCGLLGTKRLMDDFEIASSASQGTRVTCRKYIA